MSEVVEEQIRIQAPIEQVWLLISNPMNYPSWSPEATGTRRRGRTHDSQVESWRIGDQFLGTNRLKLPWFTLCTVTERDELQRFGFDVDLGPIPIAHWRYEVEPDARGTLVTETWIDRRSGLLGAPVRLVGPLVGRGKDAAAHNRVSMRKTLQLLQAHAEAAS